MTTDGDGDGDHDGYDGYDHNERKHKSVYRHIEASLPSVTLSADRFLVACGTRPLRRPDVPFDGSRVFDSDQLLWGGVKVVRPPPCHTVVPCRAVHMCARTHHT